MVLKNKCQLELQLGPISQWLRIPDRVGWEAFCIVNSRLLCNWVSWSQNGPAGGNTPSTIQNYEFEIETSNFRARRVVALTSVSICCRTWLGFSAEPCSAGFPPSEFWSRFLNRLFEDFCTKKSPKHFKRLIFQKCLMIHFFGTNKNSSTKYQFTLARYYYFETFPHMDEFYRSFCF